ncbi:MAG: TldD/PmbA family protein [Thermodesulfobacteriota bacterium]
MKDDNRTREEAAGRSIDAIKRLLKGRADAWEIFYSFDTGVGVEAKDGQVDALKARTGSGVGLRTLRGGRQGFGFSSVLSEGAFKELVDNTLAGSLEAARDEFLSFPSPAPAPPAGALRVFDDRWDEGTEQARLATAIEIERVARAYDSRINRVRKASYQESLRYSRVVNSNGVDASHTATYYSGSVTAVAEQDGESQMGWDMEMGHTRDRVDPDQIGTRAGQTAVRLLGARKIKTVKCPAVFENLISCEMLEALATSMLGDNVRKGKSMLIDKVGKKVVSGVLNVWDDGLLPGGWSSSAFDGEGVPRSRTPLLSAGVLRGYLYDSYWAKRAGAASTGNASRSSFKGLPSVGISNLYIENGTKTLDELFSEMGDGLFITELLGVHTINSVTGDYSLGAAGFRVEGGKVAYPVRGMAVAGNLLDTLMKVGGCADDLRFVGSIGAPSLLINEIEASGS